MPTGDDLGLSSEKAGGFAPSTLTKGGAFGIRYFSGLNSRGQRY